MIKINILGKPWVAKVLDGDRFNSTYGKEYAGITVLDSYELVFHADDFSEEVVVHELVHAYYTCLCVSSASLKPSQVEEVFCDLFARYHRDILRNAKIILRELEDDA